MGMFNNGYYTENDLLDAGFASIGKNVLISKDATIVGLNNISIGNNVRIDGYTTITSTRGKLVVGSNIHIAAYCLIASHGGIVMEDFSGLSHGVKLYSGSDDYSGKCLTNPTVPSKYKTEIIKPIHIGRHVIIGSSSVVLPGVKIGEGASVGAMSLVTKSLDEWGVYFGSPVKKLKNRSKKMLELEAQYLEDLNNVV